MLLAQGSQARPHRGQHLIQTAIHHEILLYRQQRLPIDCATVNGAGRGETTMNKPQILADYEVLVVGGGAAGLSGALVLARSRRSVLVIDAGEPRNAPAAAMHDSCRATE